MFDDDDARRKDGVVVADDFGDDGVATVRGDSFPDDVAGLPGDASNEPLPDDDDAAAAAADGDVNMDDPSVGPSIV